MTDRVLAVAGRGLLDPETPVVRGDDLGVMHGDGIFETLRVLHRRPFLLSDHLRRMQAGADRIDLRLPAADEWRELVAQSLTAFGAGPGVLRLSTTRGPAGVDQPLSYLTISPSPIDFAGPQRTTTAVSLPFGMRADERAAAPWLLGGVKSTSYAVAKAAMREAARRGATDAIWISSDGEVLEGASANVVWVRDGAAYTIPAETGILVGTTLAHLRSLDGVQIEDSRTTLAELQAADEILLLSAVRGLAAVLDLDGQSVGSGEIGPVGRWLHAEFESAFSAASSPDQA